MTNTTALFLTTIASALLASNPAALASSCTAGQAVAVEIRTDDGRTLPLYTAPERPGSNRYYAEAIKGDRYTIVVRNNLDRRVGLVIAVDGRNIISGKKSWLKNDEQMYILDPYSTQEHSGWRTAQDKVNRFYFTTVDDSYAAAFKDESAMGVIAVAAYPERVRIVPPRLSYDSRKSEGDFPSAPAVPVPSRAAGAIASEMAPQKDAVMEKKAQPGTGYGEETYSPSRRVSFDPEALPREKTFIKYEWRETLCRLGVLAPERPSRPGNRLWDGEFAPPPPSRWSRN